MIPKMKPFDLQAAINGAKLITRDGRNAKFVAYLPDVPLYVVVALIEGNNAVDSFSVTGTWRGTDLHPEGDDLFMKVETKTFYANLYRNAVNYHNTEADARSNCDHDSAYAVAIPISIEVKDE